MTTSSRSAASCRLAERPGGHVPPSVSLAAAESSFNSAGTNGEEVWQELAHEISTSQDLARLSALLHHGDLMCCTTAVHRGADNERWRPVWVGVGRLASHGDLTVFIFSRSLAKFAARCWEGLYCVLPIVSNIQVDAGNGRLVFYWSARAHARRLRHRTVARPTYNEDRPSEKPLLGFIPAGDRGPAKFECMGDLHLEGIPEGSRVCELLMECHQRACILGLTFHSEQRANHKELLTLYRDYLPMDLAELRSAEMVVPTELQEPSRSANARGLVMRPTLKKRSGLRSGGGEPTVKLVCITWNVGATGPMQEASLSPLLQEVPDAGIICIGMQEVCKLNARRIVQDGNEWLAWKEWAGNGVKEAFGDKMEFLHHSHLVGLLIVVFVRSDLMGDVSGVRSCKIATGVGGYGGNKGAACIRFDVGECSMCFVNCHLAAGQEKYIERCADFQSIFERISFAQEALPDDETSVRTPQATMRGPHRHTSAHGLDASASSWRAGRGGSTRGSSPMINMDARRRMTRSFNIQESDGGSPAYTVHDHHHVIWLGDTNSRIHSPGNIGGVPIEEAVNLLKEYKSRLGELRQNDQLNMMKAEGLAFVGFEEQDILFLPSYKWWPNKDMFDIRSQKHIPAWTDRVLWRSMVPAGLKPLKYDLHLQLKQSDHRPVYAIFAIGGEDGDFMPQGGLLADSAMSSVGSRSNGSNNSAGHFVTFGATEPIAPPQAVEARRSSRRGSARSSFMSSTGSSNLGEWRMSYSDSYAFQEAVVRAVRNFLPPEASGQQQRSPQGGEGEEFSLERCSEESDSSPGE